MTQSATVTAGSRPAKVVDLKGAEAAPSDSPASAEELPKVTIENVQDDPRHPLYLGDWERSVPGRDTYFAIDDLDEPHIKRKNAILQKHPEIKELYGSDTSTMWITIAAAAAQVGLAYLFGRVLVGYTWTMLATAYVVGGSFTSLYGVIIHETCHSLAHPNHFVNRLVGLCANVGIVFPIAMSFRRHHLEHHTYQGVIGKDPDLPLDWELKVIGNHPFLKVFWVFCYPLMYVVRGAAQGKRLTPWEIINIFFTICTDILVWLYCGPVGFLYLFLSLWMGYGLHIGAVHFIQEHYTFNDGQETYSYYGSGNKLFMNIGFHNEHHDFVKVPWSRLPAVRETAPEFYNTLAYHTSWARVLWMFITDTVLSPQSRAVRFYRDHLVGRRFFKVPGLNSGSDKKKAQ
ncbi:sphingolipid delta-4 desaturase [Tieghemiomyces parasiticus]|uniref:Sphingolipid delta-4 desaturase n=1 Tax=Tieghemiomyces parasiticus TaxID=78921 RepID=A0A9W8DJ02_9FUNG|nr:sphingolipid delta-4 desaturase [Tieghemiomyces parasiticus]